MSNKLEGLCGGGLSACRPHRNSRVIQTGILVVHKCAVVLSAFAIAASAYNSVSRRYGWPVLRRIWLGRIRVLVEAWTGRATEPSLHRFGSGRRRGRSFLARPSGRRQRLVAGPSGFLVNDRAGRGRERFAAVRDVRAAVDRRGVQLFLLSRALAHIVSGVINDIGCVFLLWRHGFGQWDFCYF